MIHLQQGPLLPLILRLSWPSIGGFLGIILFHLTDTFFVSRLGTEALAAMGFTFPVVTLISSVAIGISLGSGSVLARAAGEGKRYQMQRTTTDGILLSLLFIAAISSLGLLTLGPLFRLLGAQGASLALAQQYMFIWYLGAMTVVMPPVCDSCLRATGDMVRPFFVMMVCAVGNAILDPILIFGLFGLPAMGIKGAALATVISRFIGMLVTLSFLHFHAGLLSFSRPKFAEVRQSWKRILHIGLPAAITQTLPYLSKMVLTRLAAGAGGAGAVAALAIGVRIEGFTTLFMMACSLAVVPIVGQNWGAGQWRRVAQIRHILLRLALVSGFMIFFILLFVARPLSRIFSPDQNVVRYAAIYLYTGSFSLAALSYLNWTNQALNAAGKALSSVRTSAVAYLLCITPLVILGAGLGGFVGMVLGLSCGQYLGALWAFGEGAKALRKPGKL